MLHITNSEYITMNIKFTTENWNNILKDFNKIKAEDFNSWFKKISPSYKFIKNLKETFTRSKKGYLIGSDLPSLTFGSEVTWEDVFFVNHGIFFNRFVKELNSLGYDYWQEYLECLESKPKVFIPGYLSVLEHALNDYEFLEKNYSKIVNFLLKANQKLAQDDEKDIKKIEELIKMNLSYLNKFEDVLFVLKGLSNLLNKIPEGSVKHYVKMIQNNPTLSKLRLSNESDIHPLIKNKIQEFCSYEFVIDSAVFFTLNLQNCADEASKDKMAVTLAIQAFMETLRAIDMFKDSYFYEMRMSLHEFSLKTMLKDEKDHRRLKYLIEKLLDILEDETNDSSTDYEAMFNHYIMVFDNSDNVSQVEYKVKKF